MLWEYWFYKSLCQLLTTATIAYTIPEPHDYSAFLCCESLQ